MNICLALFLAMLVACIPSKVNATFSIIACDSETGACGAAVATHNLAVGASVVYAKAGVGAVVTQFETNPHYGKGGLDALQRGLSPAETIQHLLNNDADFDGTTIAHRQVSIIALGRNAAVYTGDAVLESHWAGSAIGDGFAVLGNGLVGKAVIDAMQAAFVHHSGTLAERLVFALQAGENAGGQSTGSMSAAVIVRTPQGFPLDIDFRVDASRTPIRELSQLLNFHYARQHIIGAQRAARNQDFSTAKQLMLQAIEMGGDWDRIVRRAAHLSLVLDEKHKAVEYLRQFKRLNPDWFDAEVRSQRYDTIRGLLIEKDIITL